MFAGWVWFGLDSLGFNLDSPGWFDDLRVLVGVGDCLGIFLMWDWYNIVLCGNGFD